MNEVITDKDKEYEAMEQSSAPGPDQAMSDRVEQSFAAPAFRGVQGVHDHRLG